MKFTTPVELPAPLARRLTPHSAALAFGSCFADHIGQRLADSLPEGNVAVNPSGTLYNPESLRRALLATLGNVGNADFQTGFFQTGNGAMAEWRHWDYSTRFAATDREQLERQLIDARHRSRELLRRAAMVIVTFSTDHVFRLKGGERQGTVVANCHKMAGTLFSEDTLDLERTIDEWTELLGELSHFNPEAQVVFTLSPYRYKKWGLHENALIKARLLLLIDTLQRRCPNVLYFPAYEIITDELRDYRFYAPDMLHPTEQAVDYVWERFAEWAFSPELTDFARERAAELKRERHIPRNVRSR